MTFKFVLRFLKKIPNNIFKFVPQILNERTSHRISSSLVDLLSVLHSKPFSITLTYHFKFDQICFTRRISHSSEYGRAGRLDISPIVGAVISLRSVPYPENAQGLFYKRGYGVSSSGSTATRPFTVHWSAALGLLSARLNQLYLISRLGRRSPFITSCLVAGESDVNNNHSADTVGLQSSVS